MSCVNGLCASSRPHERERERCEFGSLSGRLRSCLRRCVCVCACIRACSCYRSARRDEHAADAMVVRACARRVEARARPFAAAPVCRFPFRLTEVFFSLEMSRSTAAKRSQDGMLHNTVVSIRPPRDTRHLEACIENRVCEGGGVFGRVYCLCSFGAFFARGGAGGALVYAL